MFSYIFIWVNNINFILKYFVRPHFLQYPSRSAADRDAAINHGFQSENTFYNLPPGHPSQQCNQRDWVATGPSNSGQFFQGGQHHSSQYNNSLHYINNNNTNNNYNNNTNNNNNIIVHQSYANHYNNNNPMAPSNFFGPCDYQNTNTSQRGDYYRRDDFRNNYSVDEPNLKRPTQRGSVHSRLGYANYPPPTADSPKCNDEALNSGEDRNSPVNRNARRILLQNPPTKEIGATVVSGKKSKKKAKKVIVNQPVYKNKAEKNRAKKMRQRIRKLEAIEAALSKFTNDQSTRLSPSLPTSPDNVENVDSPTPSTKDNYSNSQANVSTTNHPFNSITNNTTEGAISHSCNGVKISHSSCNNSRVASERIDTYQEHSLSISPDRTSRINDYYHSSIESNMRYSYQNRSRSISRNSCENSRNSIRRDSYQNRSRSISRNSCENSRHSFNSDRRDPYQNRSRSISRNSCENSRHSFNSDRRDSYQNRSRSISRNSYENSRHSFNSDRRDSYQNRSSSISGNWMSSNSYHDNSRKSIESEHDNSYQGDLRSRKRTQGRMSSSSDYYNDSRSSTSSERDSYHMRRRKRSFRRDRGRSKSIISLEDSKCDSSKATTNKRGRDKDISSDSDIDMEDCIKHRKIDEETLQKDPDNLAKIDNHMPNNESIADNTPEICAHIVTCGTASNIEEPEMSEKPNKIETNKLHTLVSSLDYVVDEVCLQVNTELIDIAKPDVVQLPISSEYSAEDSDPSSNSQFSDAQSFHAQHMDTQSLDVQSSDNKSCKLDSKEGGATLKTLRTLKKSKPLLSTNVDSVDSDAPSPFAALTELDIIRQYSEKEKRQRCIDSMKKKQMKVFNALSFKQTHI